MTNFPVHTLDSAPEDSRQALQSLHAAFAMIPNIAGAMTTSPVLISSLVGIFGNVHGGRQFDMSNNRTETGRTCVPGTQRCGRRSADLGQLPVVTAPAATHRPPNRFFAASVTGVYMLTRLPSGSRNWAARLPQGIVFGSRTTCTSAFSLANSASTLST